MKVKLSWLCIRCWNQEKDGLRMCKSPEISLTNEGNLLLQFVATISGCLAIMAFGITIGWSSPSIPYLTSAESKIPITVTEGAWITSILNLGTILGYWSVPLFINRLGRKKSILFYAIFQIIAWFIIIFSNSFIILCAGRIIIGFATGGPVSVMSIYIGEISEKRVRGMLSSIIVVFSDLGIFVVATAGAYLPYNIMNLVLFLVPILHVISFVFMPESPYFYLMNDRDDEAVKSLMRLRGLKNADGLQSEIEEIKTTLNEIKNSAESSVKQLCCKESNRKAITIIICAAFASLSSGSLAMLAYAQEIFSYSGFLLTPAHSFMIVVAVKIVAGFTATQLMERFERKTLFLSSGVTCSICLGIVGLFFYSKYQLSIDVSSISWLPLMCLISFQIAAAMGLGPILFIMMGEFFSMNVKQAAVPVSMTIISSIGFCTELMFPFINRSAGIHVSFWIFATCCFVGSVFSFCIIPETRGKSLEQIQSILSSKRK